MSINRHLTDFFETEIREYSVGTCIRAIPSGVDGMVPSQRKALYGMMKLYPTQEVKVSIGSASLMAASCFHHGSLEGVISNMARDYPGTNNMPLLEGIGQLGSRLSPDVAAARYVFVKLPSIIKSIFHSSDDPILERMEDDGEVVEPKFYLPILPMILVNGSDGMGMGYASKIFGYSPKQIHDHIIAILDGKEPKSPLVPWFRGYTGTVEKVGSQTVVTGCIEVVDSVTLKITELPIGQYTIKYREVLNALEDSGIIKRYSDNSTGDKTEFVIKTTRETAAKDQEWLLKTFKLVGRDTENFTVWDEKNKIRKFVSADELLQWFVSYRLSRYDDRKNHILSELTKELTEHQETKRFILYYRKHGKDWNDTPMKDIESDLRFSGFVDVNRLLSIRLSRLTLDAITELDKKIIDTTSEKTRIEALSSIDMYKADLKSIKSVVSSL